MCALANEEFRIAGELMASSVAQGGPAPNFLNASTFAYIIHGVASVTADNSAGVVENVNLKEAIEKVYLYYSKYIIMNARCGCTVYMYIYE